MAEMPSMSDPPLGDEERALYTSISGTDSSRVHWTRKFLRYALFTAVVAAFAGLALDKAIDRLIEGSDARTEVHGAMSGVVELEGLANVAQTHPFRNDPSCPPDGSVCICTGSYTVSGKDSYGFNKLEATKLESQTACQPWKFMVGDLIFVEKPSGHQKKFQEASIVARFTGSPVVHNAMVTRVPPIGEQQTGENVIVTEALKGVWKKVVQNTIRTLVERYPFGGVSIRRVDAEKYPNFFSPVVQSQITSWADSIVGQPFDTVMVNPAKKRLFTDGRFIDPIGGPSCDERKRADKMYAKGGPKKWICTQLLAWTLAFPGGLNLDPTNTEPLCDVPKWVVKDMQPNPGDMLTAPFVAKSDWKIPCGTHGCWIGVPATAAWAGGTTAAPTTLAPLVSPTCVGSFSHQSSKHKKICFTEKKYAEKGFGPCKSWCTLDPDVGSGCGDNAKKLCCPGSFPYAQAHASFESAHNKLCFTTSTYAKQGFGPCQSWCTRDADVGSGCGDNKKKLCQLPHVPTPTPDGKWFFVGGHATISGPTLKDSKGTVVRIFSLTDDSFGVTHEYGGGHATYTQDKILWANGSSFSRTPV